jgi:Kdo2-lipid IVA lauroyltransferase/acyltransferase
VSRSRLRHRVEHRLVLLASAALAHVPESVATAFGSSIGWLAGSALRIRRGTVEANLERAFPDRSADWRAKVAAATYRHFGREAVSLLRMQRLEPGEIRERTEVEGLELLRDPIAEGRGVIGLVGHFGNWEVAGASATTRGLPVDAVAKRQANALFDGYMEGVRAHLGMGVLYRDEAVREVLKRLKGAAPKVVAIVADQNAGRSGVFVDFFGTAASTVRGPGVLALRSEAPVVFVDARRLPGSRARYHIRFSPLSYDRTGDLEEDVRRLTQAYMGRLEAAVREEPAQYFWFHKRWKTRPADLEPGPARPVPGAAGSAGRTTQPRAEERE